ncbi:integrase family protein [Candidatus Nitrosarchaeum limnium SFB1]|jgi:integrase/recombinase XerD|uniref:Integrase family protein n=1 Tax=Candidatus Nitrosarchaeum limnium SFB1 TaxID=886738 RepID=F3KKU2_9ARCH|nr:integrase family protein [Candidatus Nitrosarchaeum limnium SFB1]
MSTKQRQIITISESNLANATKREYEYRLKQFFKDSSIKSYEELIKVPSNELENILVDYSKFLLQKISEGKLSPNTMPKMFKPIKYVLGINYRENDVKWRPIESLFPPEERRSGYKAWSTEQVQEMIDKCTTTRNKALIHFMASVGGRIGIHDHQLLMKHLIPMSSDDTIHMDCYAVLLYAESDESADEKDYRDSSKDVVSGDSYWAFLTPEATKWLKRYHGERQRCGEILDGDAPIFRNEFSVLHPNANLQQLSKQAVFNIFHRALNHTSINRTLKGRRYDTQLMHGFRKRFNTIMKLENSVNANIAEKIMGHKNGLDGVYFMPTRQQCFKEFIKGIAQLTIDVKERQKIQISDQSQRINELEKAREITHNLKLENQEKAKQIDVKVNTIKNQTNFFSDQLREQRQFILSMEKKLSEMAYEIKELRKDNGSYKESQIILKK